jgi:ribosomal protein S18 acetylase RimI-like enzyme
VIRYKTPSINGVFLLLSLKKSAEASGMNTSFSFSEPCIRFAQLADVELLEKLVNSAYRGDSSRKGWTTEADLLDGIRTNQEQLKQQISGSHSTMLIYEDTNKQPIACVYLENKENTLYLGMLTVQPDFQAEGIGKKLLQAAEEYAVWLGKQAIQMTVISVRAELIAWYQRRGYQVTDKKEKFPTDTAFGIPKQALEFVVLIKPL